jgi:hypothetical protein
VAYFYFDFRDENKKHRHNLLPSLLVQFAACSITCCDIISRVYSAHGKGMQQPSDEVLINCLTDMLSAMSQHPVYIIVDALYESPNTTGVRSPRERVLSLIKDLIDLHLPDLHLCATSRLEIDIRNRLEPLDPQLVSLHDHSGHKEDIAKYIRSEVDFIATDKIWRDADKVLDRWSLRPSLRKPMACKVLLYFLRCIFSPSIMRHAGSGGCSVSWRG